MKVAISVITVRNALTDELISVEGISDMYSEVCIQYPHNLIARQDIINWATEIWGDRALSVIDEDLKKFSLGRDYFINGEAKDIPSIGYVKVSLESKEVEFI